MRINKYVAQATGMSRRAADTAIAESRVQVNGQLPQPGQQISDRDVVTLDNQPITPSVKTTTILLHKPVGFVCSRNGQGSHTIYELLVPALHKLKPVGRLDKDSSGLLLLTDDGQLAHQLTHPSFGKTKVYTVWLNNPLSEEAVRQLQAGVQLEDGPSHLTVTVINSGAYEVRMSEGRNRQIRRTFEALGYRVEKLHRTQFGEYSLDGLEAGLYRELKVL